LPSAGHCLRLVLRSGTLHVKSTRAELPDARFVLQTARAVDEAPDDHESDNLVCDACAVQNHAKAAATAAAQGLAYSMRECFIRSM
jgi:hypothetical protein